MFTLSTQGDYSPTVPPTSIPNPVPAAVPPAVPPTAPVTHTEPVRHILFGSLAAVQATIKQIHMHGYAHSNNASCSFIVKERAPFYVSSASSLASSSEKRVALPLHIAELEFCL